MLPVWHGARGETVDAISCFGCARLVDDEADDPGRHGNGRCTAVEAAYSCEYASVYPEPKPVNANGEWVALLCAAVVGVAYPITPCRDDFPSGSLPPSNPSKCKYYGRGFNRPADTHIAGVDRDSYVCTSVADAGFHEVVSDRDSQIKRQHAISTLGMFGVLPFYRV